MVRRGMASDALSDKLSTEELLRIPYVLEMWSTVARDGNWVRHAEYPELPGCSVDAQTAVEALRRIDELRVMTILDRSARGEPIPVPRPPLRA